MTDEDIEKLVSAFLRSVDEKILVDKQTHMLHHKFVEGLLEKQRRRQESLDRIREQVGGWAIIAILTSIGYAVYHWFEGLVKAIVGRQ